MSRHYLICNKFYPKIINKSPFMDTGNSPKIFRYSYSNSSFSNRDNSINITRELERSSVGAYEDGAMSPTLNRRINLQAETSIVSNNNSQVEQKHIENSDPQIDMKNISLISQLQSKLKYFESKYQKSLQEISSLAEHNSELSTKLKTTQGQLNFEREQMENSKNIEVSRIKFQSQNSKHQEINTKLQEIRRLKDSIMVLRKERDSYRSQSDQLAQAIRECQEMERTNIEYENKLALLSQELQRLSRMNKEKGEREQRYQREKEEMERELKELRAQNISIKQMTESTNLEIQENYHRILAEKNREVDALNQKSLEFDRKIRKIEQENKDRRHTLSIENEKIRSDLELALENSQIQKQQNERLTRLIQSLQSKDSSSQYNINTISIELSKMKTINVALEQKVQGLERECSNQKQIKERMGEELKNMDRKVQEYKKMEEGYIRLQRTAEKYEVESSHLRAKIEELTVSSQRTQTHLEHTLRQKDANIQSLHEEISQSSKNYQSQLHELESKNLQIISEMNTIQQSHHQAVNIFRSKEVEIKNNYAVERDRLEEEINGLRRRIVEVEQERERIEAECAGIRENFENRMREFEKLLQKVDALERQLELFQGKAVQKQTNLHSLQESYKMQLHSVQQQMQAVSKQCQIWKEKHALNTQNVKQRDEVIKRLQGQLQEEQRVRVSVEKESSQLRNRVSMIEGNLRGAKDEERKVSLEMNEKNRAIIMLERSKQEAQITINNLKGANTTLSQKLSQKQQTIHEKSTKNQSLESTVINLERMLQETQRSTQETITKFEYNSKHKEIEVHRTVEKISREKDQAGKRVAQLERELQEVMRKWGMEVEERDRKAGEREKVMNGRIQQGNRELKEREVRIVECERVIDRMGRDIQDRESHLGQLQKMLENKCRQIEERENKIAERQRAIDNMAQEIDQLRGAMSQNEGKLLQQLQWKDQQISELKQVYNKYNIEIIPSLQTEITHLSQILQKTEQQRLFFQSQLSKSQEQSSSLDLQRIDLESKLNLQHQHFSHELQELNEKLYVVNEEKEEIRGHLEETSAQMRGYEERIEKLEGVLTQKDGEIGEKNRAMGELKDALKEMEGMMGNMERREKQLENSLYNLETEHRVYRNTMQEAIGNHDKENEGLMNKISELLDKNEQYYQSFIKCIPKIHSLLEEIRDGITEVIDDKREGKERIEGLYDVINRFQQDNQHSLQKLSTQIRSDSSDYDHSFLHSNLKQELMSHYQQLQHFLHSLHVEKQKAYQSHHQQILTLLRRELQQGYERISMQNKQVEMRQLEQGYRELEQRYRGAEAGMQRYQIENEELRKQCLQIEESYRKELRAWEKKSEEGKKKSKEKESRANTETSYESLENKYEERVALLQQQIERLHSLLDHKEGQLIAITTKYKNSQQKNNQKQEITNLKQRIRQGERQNSHLQERINSSVHTINELSLKLDEVNKAYQHIHRYAQEIEGKITHIMGSDFTNAEISTNNHMNMNNYERILKEQHESIIALKNKNLQLKKTNYNYEVEFQKVEFLKEKVAVLNQELDRISAINIELAQQLKECRMAIGEESVLERRLMEMMATIVLMSTEIEALRSRVK